MARHPGAGSKGSRLPVIGCSLGAFAIAVGIVCVGLGAAGYWWYRNHKPASFVEVSISSPSNGSTAQVGDLVLTRTTATDPAGIYRLELYADGALITAQNTQLKDGEDPMVMSGGWTPLSPGRHVLVARGYHTETVFADSPALMVDVAPGSLGVNTEHLAGQDGSMPSLNSISQLTGVPLDQLLAANPSLNGTDPNAPLPTGGHVEIPLPSSPPPGTAPGGGTGPGLGAGPGGSPGGAPGGVEPRPSPPPGRVTPPDHVSATASSCTTVQLTWTDSLNEDQYLIYRMAPGETRMHVIATLRANSVSFTDTVPSPGTYYYQVASVVTLRESLSTMVRVQTPDSCTRPGPPGSDLLLTMAYLDTNDAYSGVYCYASVNSRSPDRIPSSMSTMLSAERFNPRIYNLNRLPDRGRYVLTGHPATTPVTLFVECLGVMGTTRVDRLGSFTVSHPSTDWNSSMRTADAGGFRLRYCIGPTAGVCGAPMVGVDPTIPEGTVTDGTAGFIPWIFPLFELPSPTNLRIGYSSNSEVCADAPADQQYACNFMSMFVGVQSLMWDWTANGVYTESMLTGYHVTRQTSSSTGYTATQEWDVRRLPDGRLLKATLPRIQRDFTRVDEGECGNTYTFTVSAMVGDRRSPPSDPLTFSTAPCSDRVNLYVSFESMQLNVICDFGEGCFLICPAACDDPVLETYGWFGVYGITDEVEKRINGHPNFTCSSAVNFDITSGSYRGGQFLMTNQMAAYPRCTSGPALYNNNDIHATITQPFRTVNIDMTLVEIDTSFELTHGSTCRVRLPLAGRSLRDWANFGNQTFTVVGWGSDADCTVTFRVSTSAR